MRQVVIPGSARPTCWKCASCPIPRRQPTISGFVSAPPASTSPTSLPVSVSIPTPRSRRWSSDTRSPGKIDAVGANVVGFAPGRSRGRADAVRRLCRHGRRPRHSGVSLSRRAQRLRGGGGSGELSDGLDRAVSHGRAGARRNRPGAQRGRRRRHRRHATGASAARYRDRHGVGIQARRAAQLRCGPRDRLPPCERRGGGEEADTRTRRRRDSRSDRRPQLHRQLPDARPARPADHLRLVGRRARREAERSGAPCTRGCRLRGSIRCR